MVANEAFLFSSPLSLFSRRVSLVPKPKTSPWMYFRSKGHFDIHSRANYRYDDAGLSSPIFKHRLLIDWLEFPCKLRELYAGGRETARKLSFSRDGTVASRRFLPGKLRVRTVFPLRPCVHSDLLSREGFPDERSFSPRPRLTRRLTRSLDHVDMIASLLRNAM